MAYDDLKAGLIERLGVTDADASDDVLLAALDEVLEEQADETEDDPGSGGTTPVVPEGAVLIDAEALKQLRADAAAGREARAEQITSRRQRIVADAVKAGKVPSKSRDHWLALMEKDEAGTVAALELLEANTIPVDEIGETAGELSSDDAVYFALFGDDDVTKKGAHRG